MAVPLYLTAAEPDEELLQKTAQGWQKGTSGLDQWLPSTYGYTKNTNAEQQVKSRNQRHRAVEANTYLNDSLKPHSTTTSGYAKYFLCIHMYDDDEKILVTLKLKCVYFPMTDLHKRWKVEGVIKTQRHQRYVCELLQINKIWKTCMQDILDDMTYFHSTNTF